MNIKDKVVVITGSTRGFGYAIAESMLEARGIVAITGRSQSAVESALTSLRPKGRVSGFVVDVRNEEQVYKLTDDVIQEFSRIDIWINNAGYSNAAGMMLDMNPQDALDMFLSNDLGVMQCTQAIMSYMRPRKQGMLVNIYGNASFLRPASPTGLYGRLAVLESVQNARIDSLLAGLEEGTIVSGVVKSLTEYGAFVHLGGIDGLIHVTDMSWGRIGNPSELFKTGDTVEAVVLEFDREKRKISLGLKQRTPDPWKAVQERYPVGSRVRGRVTNLAEYGAFVELEPGVEGLVHVSEMSWTQKIKHPSKVLSAGDPVEAQVLAVDPTNHVRRHTG